MRFKRLFNFSLFLACFASLPPNNKRRTTTTIPKMTSIIHSSFCFPSMPSCSLPKVVQESFVYRNHLHHHTLREGFSSFHRQTYQDNFHRCQFSSLPDHNGFQIQKRHECGEYIPNLCCNLRFHCSSEDQL